MGLFSFIEGFSEKAADNILGSLKTDNNYYNYLEQLKHKTRSAEELKEILTSEILTNVEKSRLQIATLQANDLKDFSLDLIASRESLERISKEYTLKLENIVSGKQTSIVNLNSAFSLSGALFIEQLRLSHLSKADVSTLLNVPQSDSERLEFLENAIKHFKNGLLEDAQNNLHYVEKLRIEKISKEDNYFILYLLGLVSLLQEDNYDLDKAKKYLTESSKYAEAEMDENAAKLEMILMGKTISDQASMQTKDVSPQQMLASEIEFYTAYAYYLSGDFSISEDYAQRAITKNSDFDEASFLLVKCQAVSGFLDKAVYNLQNLIKKDMKYALRAGLDGDLVTHKSISELIKEEATQAVDQAQSFYKNTVKTLEETISRNDNFITEELLRNFVQPIKDNLRITEPALKRKTMFDSFLYQEICKDYKIIELLDDFRKQKELLFEFKKRLDDFEREYPTYWYPLPQNEIMIGKLLEETKKTLFKDHTAALESYKNCMKIFEEHIRRIIIWENDFVSNVNTLAFSPDGKLIATGNKDGITIWDAASGKMIWEDNPFNERITKLVFSSDSRFVLSVSEQKNLVLRDLAEKKVKWKVSLNSEIFAVDISANRMYAVCGFKDKTVSIFRVSNGDVLWNKKVHKDYVRAVRFSPDSAKIVTTGDDKTIRMLDIKAGEEIWKKNRKSFAYTLAFSPDGKFIACAGMDGLELLTAEDGESVWSKLQGRPNIKALSYSYNGKYIATGGDDENIRIWDSQTGEEFWKSKENSKITGIDFSPDNRSVASSSDVIKLTLIFPITKREKFKLEKEREEKAKQIELEKKQLIEHRIKNKLCTICGAKLSVMDKLAGKKVCKECR